jgi:hypothetical protein
MSAASTEASHLPGVKAETIVEPLDGRLAKRNDKQCPLNFFPHLKWLRRIGLQSHPVRLTALA